MIMIRVWLGLMFVLEEEVGEGEVLERMERWGMVRFWERVYEAERVIPVISVLKGRHRSP